MGKFNGYKNYNHWSVALWIDNDEGLYRMAHHFLHGNRTKDQAAALMAKELAGMKTLEGVAYSKTAIRAAMVGM